jgi:hypothetical protein
MTNDLPAFENFSNAPISLTEVKAHKERSSEPWTARDALVSLLRDIDAGKVKPSSIIIVYDMFNEKNNGSTTFYVAAVRGFHKAIGMLTYCRWLMMDDTRRP